MNLVKQIMDQFSGSALGQLGSLLGTDAETTERAATAAVPSLLSALAGMASTDDGARKLTNTLDSLDTSGLGNIAQMFGGNSSSVLNKGNVFARFVAWQGRDRGPRQCIGPLCWA